MMDLYDYLKERYGENEPIFLNDIQIAGISEVNLRQRVKNLTDTGKLKRFDTGIYFIPKKTIFHSGSQLSRALVIERKYLVDADCRCGYISGLMFANQVGLTTQVPMTYEIVTNKATRDYRETSLANLKVVLRRPRSEITDQNFRVLQFLDLLKDIDSISEVEGKQLKKSLHCYMRNTGITFQMLEPYLEYYPDRLFKNMYKAGVLYGVSS